MKHAHLRRSLCKVGNGWLHDYQIIAEFPICVVEMCARCKDRKYFAVVQNRMNNLEYVDYHVRQCLQPWHPLYQREYNENIKRI